MIRYDLTTYRLKKCRDLSMVHYDMNHFTIVDNKKVSLLTTILTCATSHLSFISFSSAITIQSLWRKNLACKLKFRLLYSVIAIQAAMRGFSSRIHLKRSHHAATVVQTLWRNKNKLSTKVTADESRLNFIQNRASKKIVSFFRRIHLNRLIVKATLSLQKWFRAYLPLLRARILNRGFKRLQVRTYVHSVY